MQYEVRGVEGSEAFPYRNDIATLKEAVAIARGYPGVYKDGSATHVLRRYSKRYPDGHCFHHTSGYTHCWRVSTDGTIQPIAFYSREWATTRVDPQRFASSLPTMPYRASTLQGQLVDLARVAEAVGLFDAAKALSDHAFGWQALPFSGKV